MKEEELKKQLNKQTAEAVEFVLNEGEFSGIEYFNKFTGYKWVTCGEKTVLNLERFHYRIKPKPEYRPFTAKEFLEADVKWVIDKKRPNRCFHSIAYFNESGIVLNCEGGRVVVPWLDLLLNYETGDGKPLGVRENK